MSDAGPPRLRIDDITLALVRTTSVGARLSIRPTRPVHASENVVLPIFEGWLAPAVFVVDLKGFALDDFAASLDDGTHALGSPVVATLGDPAPYRPFSLTLAVPLRALRGVFGAPFPLGLRLEPSGRRLPLFSLRMLPLAAPGPDLISLDLLEATDSALFDAPERRLFDLQNPEEGFWFGTGIWRLRLVAEWAKTDGLEPRPLQVTHAPGFLCEDPTRRVGAGTHTETELLFDAGNDALWPVPQEGKDVPLDVTVDHSLTFADDTAIVSWQAPLPLRLRDPVPLLRTFQRLSAVGIDFGTTSTVAALYQKGYRSLLRLGNATAPSAKSAENPGYLLVEDHERLWAEMARDPRTSRFPNLLRVIRASHAAFEARADAPNAVIGELKSLPERILHLDQSPQLRDRERHRDFLLDEDRVRALIRAYAYVLGRAINRPGQDVYLHYWLTHPAKFDDKSRKILEEELKNGILLSIPTGIAADAITVSMAASEPEAFAAEVCPELAAHPALEPLVARFGELRFAVFDFGGGTLDIACGRFRPATPEEEEQFGSSTVIETLQVSGDDHLGGEYLTHELVWLTHQSERCLTEMESKDVPMMRPPTVPANNLATKPYLYKRSLAGRQNLVRFERQLGLEEVKFAPSFAPKPSPGLRAMRLDGTEVELTTLASDLTPLHRELEAHLVARIRDGVNLLQTTLANSAWGTQGDFREQGIVILLAGNSSRSAYVERVLAEALGLGTKEVPFAVWTPDGTAPFENVVLYEIPSRTERGIHMVGVTPKTAVALGTLKIANHEVHLFRRAQGFSYFLGDLRAFPPKFTALLAMGAPATDPPSWIDFGRWDTKTPFRVAKEYVPGKMTSSDPRVVVVPTGLPVGLVGRLFVAVVAPEEVALRLERPGDEPLVTSVSLAKFMR
ncbi:MAG: hypothetical protein WCI05_01105 [Myxococcales bacterium]